MNTPMWGCPMCGATENISEWGTAPLQSISNFDDDGTFNDDTAAQGDTCWDGWEFQDYTCRKCDYQFTEPALVVDGRPVTIIRDVAIARMYRSLCEVSVRLSHTVGPGPELRRQIRLAGELARKAIGAVDRASKKVVRDYEREEAAKRQTWKDNREGAKLLAEKRKEVAA